MLKKLSRLNVNLTMQVSKPFLGRQELEAVSEVFEKGYLGCGEYVKEFENNLSKFLNKETVCVSSGTAALHLSMEALGINKGDEVLVQSLTYAATFQAITACGAMPVPCDIKSNDLSLDLNDAERKISEKTKAIVPVHYAGYPGNPGKVYEFAKKYNLRVIEDAAHSFGGKHKNKLIGSNGDITCFSFDPVKTITCGEGGAVVSNDETLITKIREMRMIGIRKKPLEFNSAFSVEVHGRGWRYHMNNVNAAIGLVQFSKLNDLINRRRRIVQRYIDLLDCKDYIQILPYDYSSIAPYIFVVKLNGIWNEEVVKELKGNGIECAIHYFPPHLEPYFHQFKPYYLSNVESIYRKLISLPLHIGITDDDVDIIVKNLDHSVNKLKL